VFYQADPYGRSAWDGVRKALARHGLRMAGEATYHRGAAYATDMRAQVDILRASGADAVITGGTYAACAAFIRDAVDAGWPAPVASLSFVGSLRFIELLTSEGRRTGKDYTSRVINSEVVPSYDDPGVSAGREYLTLTERHRPGAPPIDGVAPAPLVPTLTGFEGFLDAKLLTEALRRSHGATDRESLWRAFRTIEQYDLGIGTPVSLGGTRAQGLDTVYYVRIAGDRFVPVTEWQAWAQ
jgi:ABC-type branched-subunit amino acid transport system substrate-binding protein